MTIPLWLPGRAPYVSDGDPDSFERLLYEVYLDAFVRNETRWRGNKVIVRREPLDARGRHWSFAHLTTVGKEPRRKLDIPRAERLPWVKAVLEATAPEVITWTQARAGHHLAVALPDFSYLVVIDPMKRNGAFLVTAYPIHKPSERKELAQDYRRAGELVAPLPPAAAPSAAAEVD